MSGQSSKVGQSFSCVVTSSRDDLTFRSTILKNQVSAEVM